MKRAAPSEEPQDVSSDDAPSSDSGGEAGKGKGVNAVGLPNSSKAASSAEDTKKVTQWEEALELSSDESLSSDSDDEAGRGKGGNIFGLRSFSKAAAPVEGALTRRAEMYQQYMKHIPVPPYQGSVIPFTSWMGLGRSMKQLHEQPLHYLTNVLLKRWDQQRIGSDDEHQPLDAIIHPSAMSKKRKPGGVDFNALSRHGYHGGPSVLTVRPPQEEPNWSWSTGKDRDAKEDAPESYEERERTRAAVTEGEKLIGVQNAQPSLLEKDKKNASFSQKEKRKRDRGQASRGKNYVEEEKRLLRGSGVYSGFDT
ncbi:hypothetical protein ACP70R_044164 [Stipagrostis hirtigluma subsp. patula]